MSAVGALAADESLTDENKLPAASTEQPVTDQQIRFKTRLCKHFEAGRCWYGNLCRSAHGHGELPKPPVAAQICSDADLDAFIAWHESNARLLAQERRE